MAARRRSGPTRPPYTPENFSQRTYCLSGHAQSYHIRVRLICPDEDGQNSDESALAPGVHGGINGVGSARTMRRPVYSDCWTQDAGPSLLRSATGRPEESCCRGECPPFTGQWRLRQISGWNGFVRRSPPFFRKCGQQSSIDLDVVLKGFGELLHSCLGARSDEGGQTGWPVHDEGGAKQDVSVVRANRAHFVALLQIDFEGPPIRPAEKLVRKVVPRKGLHAGSAPTRS